MTRFFTLSFLLVAGFFMGGCAASSSTRDADRVSKIPWNRPEKWEQSTGFGSIMNTQ
jgi:hypothetical protein